MSHTILKNSDLDLDLEGQIGLKASNILFYLLNIELFRNYTFQLELFIKHLNNVSDGFENW